MGLFARIEGKAPPSLTFRDNAVKSSTDGTHTYTGVSFGPARSDRVLFVLLTTNVAGLATLSVTVGGVSAALQVRALSGTLFTAEIWSATVPAGTSGNVVISGPSGSINWTSSIGVYSATGLSSISATDADTDDNATTLSTSVSVNALGIALSVAYRARQNPTGASWTGVSEDYFQTMQSGEQGASGGSFVATAAITRTVTATFSPSALTSLALAAASFR